MYSQIITNVFQYYITACVGILRICENIAKLHNDIFLIIQWACLLGLIIRLKKDGHQCIEYCCAKYNPAGLLYNLHTNIEHLFAFKRNYKFSI